MIVGIVALEISFDATSAKPLNLGGKPNGLQSATSRSKPTPRPAPTATPTPTPAPTAPSGTPLVISAVGASAITQTGATITWSVSAPATGQTEYGTTLGYGTFSTLENSYIYTTHIQQLAGLAPGTLYQYRTHSTDATGSSAVSAGYTFTTLSASTPTPTPTPTPTLAPTPRPTPTPAGTRPFPAPVTTQTVNVPSSIDATGATDASAALNAFISSVPDGSVIAFKAGGTYQLATGLNFAARHNLVFEGNGATLRPTGPDDGHSSAFALRGGDTDIAIRDFTIIGQNNQPGVYQAATNENRMGVLIFGGARVEIANVTFRNTWSDYVEISSSPSPTVVADNVWVHDSTGTGGGDHGVALVAGTHVLIERNTFDLTAWVDLDIEPNTVDQEVGWVTFRNNTVLRDGVGTPVTPVFVEANGSTSTTNVHDITISGNRVNGKLFISITNVARRSNVVVTNNTGLTAARGPVLLFAHIDGLTVSGNVQPLTSGSLVSIVDCTQVDSY